MRKNTAKFILSCFFVFLFFGNIKLFAKNDFKINKRPDVGLKMSFLYPVQPSLKNQTLSLFSIVDLDFSSIDLDAGFRVSTDSTDSVVNFLITPLKFSLFELGLGCGYHFYDYFKVFTEQDIILNSHFAFLKGDIFRLQLNAGAFFKASFFKNQIITNNLWMHTIFLGLSLVWNINEHFRWFLSVSSIDYFDYAMIGTPFFKSGLDINFSHRLSFGADYTVKLIDMVAVAENISEMLLSVYVKVSF